MTLYSCVGSNKGSGIHAQLDLGKYEYVYIYIQPRGQSRVDELSFTALSLLLQLHCILRYALFDSINFGREESSIWIYDWHHPYIDREMM